MMNQFYPNSRRSLLSSFWQRKLFLFLFIFIAFLNTANAKTVIVGTGSGSITQNSMGSLIAGDTLAITAGTYTGASFGNIHDITIINYGGVVTFTGIIYWGAGYSGGTFLYNVNFTGSGTSTFYGFVFSGITTSVFKCFFSTNGPPFYGNRFERLHFVNTSTCFDLFDTSLIFDGTINTFKIRNSTFDNIRCDTTGPLINASENPTSGLMDSITISNCIATQTQTDGPVVTGTIFRFNIHDNTLIYKGTQAGSTDIGKFFLFGNGQLYNNYMYGGRGYITRLIVATAGTTPSETYIYNNIQLASSIYGGVDIRGNSSNYAGSPYLSPGNVHIINNTIGNKSASDSYTTAMLVLYPTAGSVELRNNLAFNDWQGGSYTNGIITDFSGGTSVTQSNNVYYTGSSIMSALADTVNCYIRSGSPLIDAGATVSYVKTDIGGIPRPQGAGYDIGAREFSTSVSFAIANAGNNSSITLPVNYVTLNGTGSSAINSSLTSYGWSQVSGPNTAVLSKTDSSICQATGLIVGTYVFSLMVKDANNDSSSATVTITVNPTNTPPVVTVGANQTITLPTSSVTLTGNATDVTGTITSHSWSQVSGPNSAVIVSATSYSTTVSGLIAGTYVFKLTATDNNNLSGSATVTITVNPLPNQPPVVNAGTNQTIVLPASSTTLNGSATDATGTVVSYLWTQLSGPNTATIVSSSSASTNITGLVVGTYTFQLQATDNNGLSGTSTISIHVNPVSVQPPVANAGANQTISLPTNSVSLNGTGSSDPVGSIVSYNWIQLSGPSSANITGASSASATAASLIQGTYVFQLTVTNNGGASNSASVTITVNPLVIAAPIANAGPNQTITLPTNSSSLDGSQSYVPNGGSIASYNWVQISGPGGITITNSTTATPDVTGLQAGVYVFQLTVTNSVGVSASAQVTITVLPGNAPPISNAGKDTTVSLPITSITLDGSASYAPSGTISSYQWSQISGPNTASFASVSTSITSVYGLQPGIYTFNLTVTDNNGATASSTVSDTVVDNLRTGSNASLLLYPNPTSSNINLQITNDTSGSVLVFIYDMLGNLVMSSQFTKQSSFFSTPINVSLLRQGTYTLQAIISNKDTMIAKFIKQ